MNQPPAPANGNDQPPVISVQQLAIAFGGQRVLRGVDLAVYPGENVVVLGRSGSGKSVLIRLIIGLLRPDSGSVSVLGQDVTSLKDRDLDALRQKIGFLFQSGALYDSMTVRENLEFPLVRNVRNLSQPAIDRAVQEALDHVGLPETLNQMPAELSGGQRKRIGIARTLILKPAIMLYDEPTAGLDPITCTEINQLINDVRREYKTSAIIITHDLTCARATGDRVAMLLDGQLARQGTFDEVFATDNEQIKQFYAYNFVH
jgi:phospholipid/cholesterol/gamma-HCH transport system ATP-binding protein